MMKPVPIEKCPKKEPVCKNCGQCCMIKIRNNPKHVVPCFNLRQNPDGTTYCGVWGKREKLLAKKPKEYLKINFGRRCVERTMTNVDYEGCEYNDGVKPVVKVKVKVYRK